MRESRYRAFVGSRKQGQLTLQEHIAEAASSTRIETREECVRVPAHPPQTGDARSGLAPDELANLAHELRTPLSAIYSMAELMAEEQFGPVGDPRYESYAAGIRDTARHMLQVIEAMLTGRDAGLFDGSEHSTADIAAIAIEVNQALRTIAEQAGVVLDLMLEPEMPAVRADRTAIAQILFNLASNAIRHSGAGARAAIRSGIDVDGYCWLEVEDDGPGLPLEDGNSVALSHLAQVRQNPGRRRHGLGLPLTQKLAGDNGARLSFHAVHPHGTRARITFGTAAELE